MDESAFLTALEVNIDNTPLEVVRCVFISYVGVLEF